MTTYRNLTGAELYAIELRARRMRQEALGQLLRAGYTATKAAFGRVVSYLNAKEIRHA